MGIIFKLKIIIPLVIFLLLFILESFFPLFKNREKRILHGIRNLTMFIINTILIWIIFKTFTERILILCNLKMLGITCILKLHPVFKSIVIILLFDLWMYTWHRMNHRFPVLWRFHRVHHSDPEMDVTTATRFHFGEMIISSVLRLTVFMIIGMNIFTLFLYETVMMVNIYLHHSNIFLPERIDKILRNVIVTPWMHWVHHSHLREETDSNYGVIFSWWDRIFKSFRIRKDPEKIEYGLSWMYDPAWQSIWGMLKTPFVKINKL